MSSNQPNKLKIVIVDDDDDILKILTYGLESEGFEVKGITDGKKALEYLLDEKNMSMTSLLILDRVLPDMDGIQILKQLREKFTRHIPVLILSMLSAERDVLTGLKSGAIDYITKPFSLQILMEKVLHLLEQYPS